jgi:hypothetical protein
MGYKSADNGRHDICFVGIIFFMARDVEETIRGRKWDCTT